MDNPGQVSIEAERSVIGAIIIDPESIQKISLHPDDFTAEWNREIFRLACADHGDSGMFAAIAVGMNEKFGPESGQYIMALASDTPSASNITAYADIVSDCSKARAVSAILGNMRDATRSNWRDVADTAMAAIVALGGKREAVYDRSLKETLISTVAAMDDDFNSPSTPGITSGFPDFDELTGGLHDSDLIIIGARPAMGKTALLLRMAAEASIDRCVGVISSEQAATQVAKRLVSMTGRVPGAKLRNPRDLNDHDWAHRASGVSQLMPRAMRINDKSTITIQELKRLLSVEVISCI